MPCTQQEWLYQNQTQPKMPAITMPEVQGHSILDSAYWHKTAARDESMSVALKKLPAVNILIQDVYFRISDHDHTWRWSRNQP